MEHYYGFVLLAILAEILGTISGFGSSILFVPIASLFFDFHTVLGVTAVFHVFSNITKILLFRKGIDKHIAWYLGVAAVVSVILGALLTKYIPVKEMELGMNILLVMLALYLLRNLDTQLAQTRKNLVVGGAVSGFLAGLVGTGGAIRGLTLAAFNLPKDIFIATSALIDLGVDSSRAFIYIQYGYFTKEHWLLIPMLIAVSLIGTWIGKWVLAHTSQTYFKYIVLGIIVVTAVWQLVNYFIK